MAGLTIDEINALSPSELLNRVRVKAMGRMDKEQMERYNARVLPVCSKCSRRHGVLGGCYNPVARP